MNDHRQQGESGPGPMDSDLLRRVLAAQAERIEPAPGALAGIQHRIRAAAPGTARRGWWSRLGRPRPGPPGAEEPGRADGDRSPGWTDRRRWGGWSPIAAGAVTVATLSVAAVVVGLAGTVVPNPIDRRAGPPAGQTSGDQPSATPVAPPGAAPGPTPAGPAPSVDATGDTASGDTSRTGIAVYYQGGDPGRPRLYREFHRLWLRDGSAADRITAAVRNLFDSPLGMDPDYRNGWPVGTDLRGVSVSGGTATVDLGGAARNDVDAAVARLAVQQLVWTVTAVPGVSGVRLRLDGKQVDRLWGRVDVSGVLRRAPAVEVLAPVWLIAPQHGDAVGRTFEVHLAGILPEATAQLRIQQDGRVVHGEVVTLSIAGPAQGEHRLQVTLPPGRYTVTAYATSLEDGREQHLDDHLVTVR